VSSLLEGDVASTKAVRRTLSNVSDRSHLLVVVRRDDDLGALSTRNLPTTHVLYADQVNTYDVMLSDDVVFTVGALEDFVAQATLTLPTSIFAAAKAAPAGAAAPGSAEAPFGEGSAVPMAAVSGAEGLTSKRKRGSMKFRTPVSPWYGRTKAEV